MGQMIDRHEGERKKILGIHSGALGDVVLFARLLGEMGGRVTLVAGGEKAKLLVRLGAVERGLDFDIMPMHEVFNDTPPEDCRLRELLGGHDRLVSCFATGNPAAEKRLATLCGVTEANMLAIRPEAGWRGHLLDMWREMLSVPRGGHGSSEPWSAGPDMRGMAREILLECGVGTAERVIVIHPGAGGEQKCWPMECFVELARMIEAGGAARAVIVLGPVECERLSSECIASLGKEAAVVQAPSLAQLAGMLAVSAGFVGNDSGPGHLAAALGTPVVVLFGPTRAQHFAPVSAGGAAVVTISRGSLNEIGVQDVFEAVLDSARPA